MYYPTVQDIIVTNKYVIIHIPAKRGDAHSVHSYQVLRDTVKAVKNQKGDIYDKATVLLVMINRGHPFGSANRRTAYAVTKTFLELNGYRLMGTYESSVMMGIREKYYKEVEIKAWLMGHGIRAFSRW